MSLLRPFCATDLFRFNNINLDKWTETYQIDFYLDYILKWPELVTMQESVGGNLLGYVMGKTQGDNNEFHGHVTAITICPQYRGMGVARSLMDSLELQSERLNAWFVDLYVRVSNSVAIGMYEKLGYSVYRRVNKYYDNGKNQEDGFDMRKSLSADVNKESVRENGRSFLVEPSECWH